MPSRHTINQSTHVIDTNPNMGAGYLIDVHSLFPIFLAADTVKDNWRITLQLLALAQASGIHKTCMLRSRLQIALGPYHETEVSSIQVGAGMSFQVRASMALDTVRFESSRVISNRCHLSDGRIRRKCQGNCVSVHRNVVPVLCPNRLARK